MIVSGPWCGFLLSRIQKHFPQPKRRRTLPPAPVVAVEEVAEDEGHDELPELPEEHSAWSDVAGDGEVEQGEEGHEEQEQHEEVEQEEEGHEELPELPEEHSAWSDDGQHGEVEQEEKVMNVKNKNNMRRWNRRRKVMKNKRRWKWRWKLKMKCRKVVVMVMNGAISAAVTLF